MVIGSWLSQAIHVVAKLNIADMLSDGPMNCNQLAAAAGLHSQSLYRVMRALASVGVFFEGEDGKFRLTPVSELLRTDIPGSLRALATMGGEKWHWTLIVNLLNSVKSGEPSFDRVFGMSQFEFFANNPEDGKLFNQAMTDFSAAEIRGVLDAYDFSKFGSLVDVGGGQGSLLTAALRKNPSLKGVIYELPAVAEVAREVIGKESLSDRCEVIAGDFFKSIPRGGDAYILKHIIHDWDDEHSVKLLKNCGDAMTSNSTLLVVEMVITPGNDPFVGKLLDLEMLLIGGRERTEAEYRILFEAAGFKLTRIMPTQSPVSVIEGLRA
jgi:hypothetical protein